MMISLGMSGHQRTRGRTDEWLTPPALLRQLGSFDLDPCAPIDRPWDIAAVHFSIKDDGLYQRWVGRVFCNPPYSEIGSWMAKMAAHGNGIALVFARTDTDWFHRFIWGRASGILFLRSRIRFFKPDGSPGGYTGGAPSALIAYGAANRCLLERSGINGKFLKLPLATNN